MGKQAESRERWRERVTAQEASGLTVRAYCREHELGEHSFYAWRKKLGRRAEPVGFALVETKAERIKLEHTVETLELIIGSDMCLRVPCEEATLAMVLRILRARE